MNDNSDLHDGAIELLNDVSTRDAEVLTYLQY